MVEAAIASPVRSDEAIEADIHHLLTTGFAPVMHDRFRIHFTVQDGHVTLWGHVKGLPAYDFILDHLPEVPGVKSVNTHNFFTDHSIRMGAGQVVPPGVFVRVEYGAVILEGTLPPGVTPQDLVKKVALVPGVHRVVTAFKNQS